MIMQQVVDLFHKILIMYYFQKTLLLLDHNKKLAKMWK